MGFKLIQGYCKKFNLPDQLWLSKLDLVAISIASDIVAITGENRILAYPRRRPHRAWKGLRRSLR